MIMTPMDRIITAYTPTLTRMLIVVWLFGGALTSVKGQSLENPTLDLVDIPFEPTVQALGGAGGLSNLGPNSILYNPALLANTSEALIEASYTAWISNTSFQYAGVSWVGRQATFGLTVQRSAVGELQARTQPGPSTGTFSAENLMITAGIARNLGPIALGVSVSALRQEIFQYRANGISFSAGVWAPVLDERLEFGVSVEHMGELDALDQTSTELPYRLRLSNKSHIVSLTINQNRVIDVRSYIDVTQQLKESDASTVLHTGMEVDFNEQGGFRVGKEWKESEQSFSAGLFVVLDRVSLDYAFSPFNSGFGTAHSIGLRVPLTP
jgi:hypothetical protein